MNRTILEQISELPKKEERQTRASFNHYLGQMYATQKRRKKVMSEKTKIELGVEESETENGI